MASIVPLRDDLMVQQQLPAHAKVYKKAELPARWYYQDSNRIAPLIVVPEAGWRLMQQKRQQQWLAEHSAGQISGSHGYDNQHPTMQAIFIGQGPSFAAGRTIPAFANIQLYNLMCRILGITPATNDGDPAWVGQMLEPKTPVDTAE